MAEESRFQVLEETTHYPTPAPVDATADEVEETVEQKLEKLSLEGDAKSYENATAAKELGNKLYVQKSYLDAIDCYTKALKLCPADDEYAHDRAVYFSNRANCLLRLNRPEEVIEDATQAIALSPQYVKPLLRRAEAYEKLDKEEEALKDYNTILSIDPSLKSAAQKQKKLQKIVEERQEKMKAEMLDKLKGVGNSILGKFGLSTDNFNMVQDPTTGSYSINFNQNPRETS